MNILIFNSVCLDFWLIYKDRLIFGIIIDSHTNTFNVDHTFEKTKRQSTTPKSESLLNVSTDLILFVS